jgi:hypothetical protein
MTCVFFNAHEFIGKVASKFKQMFSKCKLKKPSRDLWFLSFQHGVQT